MVDVGFHRIFPYVLRAPLRSPSDELCCSSVRTRRRILFLNTQILFGIDGIQKIRLENQESIIGIIFSANLEGIDNITTRTFL